MLQWLDFECYTREINKHGHIVLNRKIMKMCIHYVFMNMFKQWNVLKVGQARKECTKSMIKW